MIYLSVKVQDCKNKKHIHKNMSCINGEINNNILFLFIYT